MERHAEPAEYPGLDRPLPTQTELETLFGRTSSVEIVEGGAAGGQPLGERVLFASSDVGDIRSLARALEIVVPSEPAGCLCHGDFAIVLRDARRAIAAVIGLHHLHSIRWDGWRFDATLKHPGLLVDWLVDRGVEVEVTEDELRAWSIDAIERHLGFALRKDGRAIHRSDDGTVVLSLTISAFAAAGDHTTYSFMLRGDQIARLRRARDAYAAYVFLALSRIIIVPYGLISAAMEGTDATVPPDAAHYMVMRFTDPGGSPLLELPSVGQRVSVSEFVISLRRPRSS